MSSEVVPTVEQCPECERLTNRDVNGRRCPYCHTQTFPGGSEGPPPDRRSNGS